MDRAQGTLKRQPGALMMSAEMPAASMMTVRDMTLTQTPGSAGLTALWVPPTQQLRTSTFAANYVRFSTFISIL